MREHVGICAVNGREILDSRGNPTVEAEVYLEDGTYARASVPSGASTGIFEAHEMRDGSERYGGKGTRQAAQNIKGEINRRLCGENALDQPGIDGILLSLDGTENKSRLGANAVLAVSVACAKAAAKSRGLPLYNYLGGANAKTLPMPMMNVINGGAHAGNSIDIQEFMLVPVGAETFSNAVRWCAEVFHTLRRVVPASGVGDEGGYAPELSSDEEALKALVSAVKMAGFEPGRDFMFSIDAATSEWYSAEDGRYYLPKRKKTLTRSELIEMWRGYSGSYPIFSIEDGCGEEDWEGWELMTRELGKSTVLVGDDLFVTNVERIKKGIAVGAGNAVLVKMNQIGTLTETMDAVETAKKAGFLSIISHRSGETEDTTIADLAVAMNAGFIKTGAPSRTDRTAKYNRLLRIEEELDGSAAFPHILK
ncbi:MAG: phosphopyruvate hydratase [Oscillospiraceae bacterium]